MSCFSVLEEHTELGNQLWLSYEDGKYGEKANRHLGIKGSSLPLDKDGRQDRLIPRGRYVGGRLSLRALSLMARGQAKREFQI